MNLELSHIFDRFPVQLQNYVPTLQTGSLGRSSRCDVANKCTMGLLQLKRFCQFRRDVLYHHSEIASLYPSVLHQAVHDPSAKIRGYCKPDTLIASTVSQDCRINAYKPTFRVDKSSSGVAGINGSVGLDEIFVHFTGSCAILSAHDSLSDGLANSKRIANRKNNIPDFNVVTIR